MNKSDGAMLLTSGTSTQLITDVKAIACVFISRLSATEAC